MSDVRVSDAGEQHLAAVTEIYGHYVRHSVATFDETEPSLADWTAKLRAVTGQGLPFLVALRDREVLGFAYAAPWRPKPAYRYTVEDTIYLAPGAGGRGVGRLLLTDLIARCTEAGRHRMIAVITDGGDPASAVLHTRLGFSEVGRLGAVGFKHDRWIDTVLFQRDLG